jgi:hypothetical protein
MGPLLRATLAAFASALLVSCGGTTIIYQNGGGGSGSASGDDPIIPRQGWLTLREVQGTKMAQGEDVLEIWVRVDGVEVGHCEVEYAEADTCLKDVPLDPGTHQLHLAIRCRDDRGNTLTCRYSGEESLTVAAGETVVYDFRASLRYPDEPDRYLSRSGATPIDDGTCHGALEALATAPSCRQEDVARALGLAERAGDLCSDDELQADAGLSLVVQAGMNHFFQSPSQCIPESQLGRRGLPDIMVSAGFRDSRWPPGTLEPSASSWSWSRDGLPRRIIDARRGREILDAIVRGLRLIEPRVAAFHALADAWNDDAKRDALANAVAREPFSLDPRTPQGHETLLLIAMRVDNATFADYVGRGVGADQRFHCGTHAMAERIARYMTADRTISQDEWDGITRMVARTPADARYHGCDYVFRGRLGGVSHDVRLRWLASFDCSNNRAQNARGRAIEVHLRDSMRGRGYDPLIDALRQQYASCLAKW